MKKFLAIVLIMLMFVPSAFALTRGGRVQTTSYVLQGSGENITTFTKTFTSSDGDGSEEVLSSTSRPCYRVLVTASQDNVYPVFIGGSTVENNWRTRQWVGTPVLQSSTSVDNTVVFYVDNVNKLYGAAWATGDVVSVTYEEF